MTQAPSTRVLMVYPQFSPHSFWNYKATCEAVGRKYSAAPLGLATVAALLPADWEIRLINCNTEELIEADLKWASLVMTGGMLPQQRDAHRIIDLAHQHGLKVVVGGPDVTCSPNQYEAADFLVLGEAEGIIEQFIEAWCSGAEGGRFKATEFPDITRSPVPRFDLFKFDQYMHIGVQFSRGCPFSCEFCNVIELNGRSPRAKTSAQVLKELDALKELGWRGHVDFVDDNLIGNRKAVKPFLADLAGWLEANGRPFEFTTEASINLADDDELLALLKKANFFAIFVGIETPNPETLAQTLKKQNTRRDLTESIRKIYRAGMFVNAGFIIGFDGEKGSVAEAMVKCIEDTSIPVCMVGLLYALPNTQLARRLQAEGRLHSDYEQQNASDVDQCTSGLNYRPLRSRRESLTDYRDVLERIYAPKAFFRRVRATSRQLDLRGHSVRLPLKTTLHDLRSFSRIAWQLGFRDVEVRGHFWSALADCLIHNPRAVKITASFAALYLHFRPFSEFLTNRIDEQLEAIPAENEEPIRSAS